MESLHTERRVVANRYVVADRIPTHGRSKLYHATQAGSGRHVVVREYAPSDVPPGEALGTLARVGAVSSRFLPDLIDAAPVDEQTIYVAHPRLDGESLAARLARKTRLKPDEAAALWARVLKGLEALHRNKLVHGSLRPTRVFHERHSATGGWHVKLLGAGVHSVTRAETLEAPELVGFVTPEWLDGGVVDARSDIWCAAAIIYTCIAGRGPCDDESTARTAARIAAGDVSSLRAIVPDVPESLASLLAQALSRDPAQRPADASAMLDVLLPAFPQSGAARRVEQEEWTRGGMVGRSAARGAGAGGSASLTQVRRQRTEIRRLQIAAVVLVAAAAAVIFAMYLQHSREQRALIARLTDERAAQERALSELARRSAAPPPTQPTPAPPPPVPVAIAADAGTRVASASPPAHHAPHDVASRSIVAPEASTGLGSLEFRAANPCALLLDGSNRGDVSYLQTTLPGGMHQIACRGGGTTQRLLLSVHPGQVTRVYINATGESAITIDHGSQ